MSYPNFSQFVCEIPNCGKTTLVQRYADCRIWLDKDDNGNLQGMDVCVEHKAAFLRLVSDFVSGSGEVLQLDWTGKPLEVTP